jgi:hypothetical protein
MTTGPICRIMDMIGTGMEVYRFSSITWPHGAGVTRRGGGVAFRLGGGGMATMAEDTGTVTHSEISQTPEA